MKRQGPEVKIITLFSALPDESKRIVYDILKSQMATPRQKTKKTEPKKGKVATVLPSNPDDFKFGNDFPVTGV